MARAIALRSSLRSAPLTREQSSQPVHLCSSSLSPTPANTQAASLSAGRLSAETAKVRNFTVTVWQIVWNRLCTHLRQSFGYASAVLLQWKIACLFFRYNISGNNSSHSPRKRRYYLSAHWLNGDVLLSNSAFFIFAVLVVWFSHSRPYKMF